MKTVRHCVTRCGWCLLMVLWITGCTAPPPPPAPRAAPAPRPEPTPQAQLVLPAILPRVMIMVDEQSLGTIATSEVEALASRRLVELGVPVLDQDMVRANLARSQQMLEMAGDARGAAALGTQFGADVVLIGEAVAKPSARRIADTNLRSYQAVVTLRAIRADNAATLAAASEDSTQVGLEDVSGSAAVLRTAAGAALDQVLPAMLTGWEPGSGGDTAVAMHRVEMTVGGVDQMWKLRAIREKLRSRPSEMQNIVQRNYSAGMAEFSLESSLPAEELAEELVLSPPEGLQLQVLDIGAGRIQLRVVER